ncbi:glycosyl transferase family 2 [Salinimicrobium marinum]|uniref:Glycosyl transferase family 2 n=1 Tax=Salinimicrobium marinum TaxID=680283 RepID=A0A918VWM0_9FLAO|nr:glycosyltransferase [Salinimicrobium marinum]GHA30361.1 glycosyl transferase family 2 [Salinimicrobium marinum]
MDFNGFLNKYQKKEVYQYKNTVGPNPLVSVCVQTYQHENYIEDCLNSILGQHTNFDFEILLGEDCSNDRTRGICVAYAEKHPGRIKLFLHHPENKIKVGDIVTGNFNVLYNLFSAKGKYIAVCEGDDIWKDPLKLQKQTYFMEQNPDYSICYHEFHSVDENGDFLPLSPASPLRSDLSCQELNFPWKHPATLTILFENIFNTIPKEVLKVINVDIFLYSLLGQKGKGKFINNIEPAAYRVHPEGIWSSTTSDTKLLLLINTFKELANYYQRINEPEKSIHFRNRIFKLYHSSIYNSLLSFKSIKAFQHLWNYSSYRLKKGEL